MRLQTYAAVIVSVLLIGGATWLRVARTQNTGALVPVAVQQAASPAASDQTSIADVYTTPSTGTSTKEQLTDTDLVARQLFSDYVSLSANGQATEANLNALADQYASNIVSINKAAVMSLTDIKVTENSHANLLAYGKALTDTLSRYQNQGNTLVSQAKPIGDSIDTNFLSGTKSLSSLYAKEAAELLAINVPQAVSLEHLKLVNFYLSQSWALKVLSTPDADSVESFAAIAALQQSGDGDTLIGNIQTTLTQNGL